VTAINQTFAMTGRHTRTLLRQPWFIAFWIMQPIIWLLLFGALFKSVVNIPGFGASANYVDYIMPGVLVMTAIFASGWSGMGIIEDLDRGIMDRFLVAPSSRAALIGGRIGYEMFSIVVQGLIIGGLAFVLGAQFEGGVFGFGALVLCALLLGASFAALSNAMALMVRQRESLIGANSFLVLPLTFLSSAFMPLALAPEVIATIAKFNPVEWAVAGGREAMSAGADWAFVGVRVGLLGVLAVICMWLATRAFAAYQRSI
jgi:ABC-2 type transport system permease protein